MQKRYYLLISIIVCIAIIGVVEAGYGWANLFFDQANYNYTSTVTIPASDPAKGSLSGYYTINGTGRDFDLFLILPGAEQGESPLDYTKDGMTGQGHIDDIRPGWNTAQYLFQGDFKSALFSTPFRGSMNVSCAAWTGQVFFQNQVSQFAGNFTIDGPMTDWEGGFQVFHENNRIVIKADYIYYPTGQKGTNNYKQVQKTYYF